MKVGDLQDTLKDCLATKAFPCVLLQSAPGTGKTESVRWVANELIHTDGKPYDLLILHPVGRDQSFIGGYPTIVNGAATHVAYGDLKQLQDATRPIICLIDDFGQCAPSVQAAFQQLIQERAFNGVRVAPEVRFVICTNRKDDRAGVTGLLSTISDRALILDVEPDVERLVQFLTEHYPDVPELGAFLIKRPGLVLDYAASEETKRGKVVGVPSPRKIEYLAKIRRLKLKGAAELELATGAVGKNFASEFLNFCSIWKSLVPLREVLANPKTAKVPDAPHELYAECGSLAHAVKLDNLEKIKVYIDRFQQEFQEYFWKLIEIQRPELVESTEYVQHKVNSKY
jgi:hypothetical protein